MKKSKVLLVHSGNLFPEYINDCISQLVKYNFEVHLVISDEFIQSITNKNIYLSPISDYIDDMYENYVTPHPDKWFRDNYWQRVHTRFFIISSYCKRNKLEKFFHIENDVLVYSDFVDITNKLVENGCEMSVIIDAENRGCPGLIYFKDSDAANRLSDHLFNNKSWNDMENLYLYFNSNRDTVINFPIINTDHNTKLINSYGVGESGNINYSNMFDIYESIFDGASIGQYLGGYDPYVKPGNTDGYLNEYSVLNPSNFKYEWVDGIPYLISNDKKIKINNLHIHSKNLKRFIK